MAFDEHDAELYRVVVNEEGQYSIWPAAKDIPLGWRDAGKSGQRAVCLEYIKEVWTDMRPRSVLRLLEEDARAPRAEAMSEAERQAEHPIAGPDLVSRLSAGEHRVEVRLHPERSARSLEAHIRRGQVHLGFPDSRGGTELRIVLDPTRCDASGADFERGVGTVRLVGWLKLDFVPVRCVAEIDLETLAGSGHLETE